MASTLKTDKMKLSQFTATDKPAWLSDYNNDMQRIDIAFDSTATELNETMNQALEGLKGALYPVGSYFISAVSTNPAQQLGFGEWARASVGRTLVGVNEADADFAAPGKTGGAKTHTLTIAEMPNHNHPMPNQGYWIYHSSITNNIASGSGLRASATGTVTPEGGGEAHNNMPPFEAVYIWKRTA